ncbi:MAG: AtpZ/AtpI family protein [Planctomycetota bacterium]|jgi:F0F1-type ATP synthase assembly protein I
MSVVGAGLGMALFVGLFAYGGYQLDHALGSSPWCLISGTMLGFVASFFNLVRTYAPELLRPTGKRPSAQMKRNQEGDSPARRSDQSTDHDS